MRRIVLAGILIAAATGCQDYERAVVGRWQYIDNDFRHPVAFNLDNRLVDRGIADRNTVADLVEKLENAVVIHEVVFHDDGSYSDSAGNEGTWRADGRHLTLTLDTGKVVTKTFDVAVSILTVTYAANDVRSALGADGADRVLRDVVDIMFEDLESLHIHYRKLPP